MMNFTRKCSNVAGENSGKPSSRDDFEPGRTGSESLAEQGTAGGRLRIVMPGFWSASWSVPKEYLLREKYPSVRELVLGVDHY